jgi:hypothetical protein
MPTSYNKYKKYKITKNLSGDKVNYIARTGKRKQVVGRAGTKPQLVKMMSDLAKELDRKFDEETAALLAKETSSSSKKKVGLWKPGKLVEKVTTAVTSATSLSDKKPSDNVSKTTPATTKTTTPSQPKVTPTKS